MFIAFSHCFSSFVFVCRLPSLWTEISPGYCSLLFIFLLSVWFCGSRTMDCLMWAFPSGYGFMWSFWSSTLSSLASQIVISNSFSYYIIFASCIYGDKSWEVLCSLLILRMFFVSFCWFRLSVSKHVKKAYRTRKCSGCSFYLTHSLRLNQMQFSRIHMSSI